MSTYATGLVRGIIPVNHLDLSLYCVIPNLHRNEKFSIQMLCCLLTSRQFVVYTHKNEHLTIALSFASVSIGLANTGTGKSVVMVPVCTSCKLLFSYQHRNSPASTFTVKSCERFYKVGLGSLWL